MDKKYTPEMSIIDPKKLIQQDGDFVGEIADKELVKICDNAQNEARDKGLSAERIEIAGNRAILQEIQKRARKLVATQVCLESQIDTVLNDFDDEKEAKLAQRNL